MPKLTPLFTKSFAIVTALASVATLTACSTPAPDTNSVVDSKVAAGALRDVELCFTNNSGTSVSVTWPDSDWNSTHDGEGTLDKGEIICGEGEGALAQVTFQDGFANYVWGINYYFVKPSVKFQTTDSDPHSQVYAMDSYSIGQTITSTVAGHSYTVTRLEDDDWINFAVTINK